MRLACALALSLLYLVEPALGAISFTPLGDLPGGVFNSYAAGVSRDGSTVVGMGNRGAVREAIRWTAAEGMVGLGLLNGSDKESQAWNVSDDGSTIVGWSGDEAFRWTAAGMVGLGDLPGSNFKSSAYSVSGDGSTVVGRGSSVHGNEAFRWTAAEGMVGLGDLPGGGFYGSASDASADGLVIVGSSNSSSSDGLEGFRWTAGEGMIGLGDLPGGMVESAASAIASDGSAIVGHSRSYIGSIEAFRWTSTGGMVGLGDLPGGRQDSMALDVSADGSKVVGFGYAEAGSEAFLWDATSGMRSIPAILANVGVDVTGWQIQEATGISGDGRVIVGNGINPQGFAEGWRVDLGTSDPSADFNDDGVIDGNDFLTWQLGESPNPMSAADLASWTSSFGQSPVAVVPEPSCVAMTLIGALGLFQFHQTIPRRKRL